MPEPRPTDLTPNPRAASAQDIPDSLIEKVRQVGHLETGLRMSERAARAVLAAVADDIRAQALRDAAADWQTGQWADAPRRADPVRERLANAQHVADWLRARADREGTA